jgi:hypothetical protein
MGSAVMPVAPRPEAAAVRRGDTRALTRAAIGVVIAAIAVIAGVGWLYLLRDAGLLGVGPRVRDALPLQQLAGDDGQPLLRPPGHGCRPAPRGPPHSRA